VFVGLCPADPCGLPGCKSRNMVQLSSPWTNSIAAVLLTQHPRDYYINVVVDDAGHAWLTKDFGQTWIDLNQPTKSNLLARDEPAGSSQPRLQRRRSALCRVLPSWSRHCWRASVCDGCKEGVTKVMHSSLHLHDTSLVSSVFYIACKISSLPLVCSLACRSNQTYHTME
jgi:hypothetical protein